MGTFTLDEILNKYNFKETEEELRGRIGVGEHFHPVYRKHLTASWTIQNVWGHVHAGNLSLGKARELTASVIEEHFNDMFNPEAEKLKEILTKFVVDLRLARIYEGEEGEEIPRGITSEMIGGFVKSLNLKKKTNDGEVKEDIN